MGDSELAEKAPSIEERQQRMKASFDSDVPRLYFSGFVCALGSGDVVIILERNGKPEAVLNTSFSVAKTLALRLADLVKNLEAKTGNTIMTTDDIQKGLQKKDQ
jgi:hypothetical protein